MKSWLINYIIINIWKMENDNMKKRYKKVVDVKYDETLLFIGLFLFGVTILLLALFGMVTLLTRYYNWEFATAMTPFVCLLGVAGVLTLGGCFLFREENEYYEEMDE